MQRGVLQSLNPLSNRVTFITIVPGAYPGPREKQNVKNAHNSLQGTVENQSLATCHFPIPLRSHICSLPESIYESGAGAENGAKQARKSVEPSGSRAGAGLSLQ